MADIVPPCQRTGGEGPTLTVAEVLRTHGADYANRHGLSAEQAKVLRAMMQCRTSALGGHVYDCGDCGSSTPMYNSCRDRHCPTCQSLNQARWIEERTARLLPVGHFHVVFTLPAELRALALHNRKEVFAILVRSAGRTLTTLGRDKKRLGVDLGVTTVLHTWTRELTFHPHVHCIVTAGGLATSGTPRWIHSSKKFLFPLRVMSKLFRGKFLAELKALHDKGALAMPPGVDFETLIRQLYATNWVSYSKAPFAGTEHLVAYLGRYTHRIGISDQRLKVVTDGGVTFRTRGDDTVHLQHDEFIRRLLLHVLPRGFHKIRHFGLLASTNVNTKLEQATKLLGGKKKDAVLHDKTWEEQLHELTGKDPRVCVSCGSSNIISRAVPARGQSPPSASKQSPPRPPP